MLRQVQVYAHTLAAALGLSALAAGAIHLPIVVAYATLVTLSGVSALAGFWFARSGARWSDAFDGGLAGARDGVRESAIQGAFGAAPASGAGDAPSSGAPLASRRVEAAALVCLGLAIASLLQAVPVPLGWLERWAPGQADIWARSLRPFGLEPPQLGSLSIAPHRTLVKALEATSYAIIFQLAGRLGQRRVSRVVAVAFGCVFVVAVASLGHRALGAERLFGVYVPSDAAVAAPLLNPNNRAGYCNLGFFCGLGLLLRTPRGPRAGLLALALLAIAIETLLCQSRGGTACLLLGMLGVPLSRPRRRLGEALPSERREPSRGVQALVVAAILAGALGLLALSRPRGGLGYEESLDKLHMFGRAVLLVRDFWPLGVGRGAFGSAFAPYQPRAGSTVFEHAENLPLQWASEWGVPLALFALGALAACSRGVLGRRARQSPVRRCAALGVCVLIAQNMVDLSLEIPAVAALAVFVLGGLIGAADATPSAPLPRAARVLGAGVGLAVLCIPLVLCWGADSPARERQRLHAELERGQLQRLWPGLLDAVRAYPGDPYLPLLGGAAALAEHQNALGWATRALERAPESAPAHVLLGRALAARGALRQALDALRRAIELDPDSAGVAMRLASGWSMTPELLVRAVPPGASGATSLEVLADASPPGPLRVRWLEAALERDPERARAHEALARELLRELRAGERSAVCGGQLEACARRARAHAERADQPPSARLAVLEAEIVELSDGPLAAEEQLARACSRFPADEPCSRALVELALRNASARLPEAAAASTAAGCTSPERCASTHLWLGRTLAAHGQWLDAQAHFQRATLEQPSAEAFRALAEAATALGQSARAEEARRRAEALLGTKNGAH
jgi:tetratricopeptide (TPR) repeat protein